MRRFTWDDLQFFLAVARNGQLASAARQLRTNHATVSRRIDRLEQALSAKLFERNPRGYMLTAVGERLVQSAEQIEREAGNFRNEASSGASPVTGCSPYRWPAWPSSTTTWLPGYLVIWYPIG